MNACVMKTILDRDDVRWGIIGCGDVTEVKSGPGFRKAARSSLVAVMRRNAVLAEDYARRHGVPRWYADAEQLIHDPEVDAVYIATPPETHLHFALKVAAAGNPAYVEKPLARNTTECDQMVAAFAQSGVPLYVAFYRRELPRFKEIKRLIDDGVIGRVSGLSYIHSEPRHHTNDQWRVDIRSAGGGLFVDLGSHVLDLFDFIFGPITQVTGLAANCGHQHRAEDVVAMSFAVGAGVPAVALWNFAAGARLEQCRVMGTEGVLEFAVFENAPIRLFQADGKKELVYPHPPHVQQPLIQTVVDDLLGRGVCASTGESACRTSRVMDVVLSSYYAGREDAFWERLSGASKSESGS